MIKCRFFYPNHASDETGHNDNFSFLQINIAIVELNVNCTFKPSFYTTIWMRYIVLVNVYTDVG